MIRGVLGGSFDPVHLGHLDMARQVLAAGLVDRISVIPAWRSPHKTEFVAAPRQRLEMVRLAFAPEPGIDLDTREIDRGQAVYTVETLTDLRAAFPEDRLRLIIGADNLLDFPRWHEPGRILDAVDLVILGRWQVPLDLSPLLALGGDTERIHHIAEFDVPVSSSQIRAMIAAGRLPVDLLPDPVARYIREHELYGA